MIRHHPDISLLTEFAAGSLPLGKSVCIAVHEEYCQHCQQQINGLSQLGAGMMKQLAPSDVDDSLFEVIMTRLDEAPGHTGASPEPGGTNIPGPLAKLVEGGYEHLVWQRLTSSVRRVPLAAGDGSTELSLIRMGAGGRTGHHTHAGNEFTVVLQGGFSDRKGVYETGDFIACSPDDRHEPVAHQDQDCICLAAQDGPIRFTGLRGLLLNRFIHLGPR